MALCHAEGVRDRDPGSLRLSISAAAVLSEEIYAGWKGLAGHGPTEGLGSTEMLHIYLSNRVDDHRHGAVGATVPGYEVKLVTPEGRPARPSEAGVMHVRGDRRSKPPLRPTLEPRAGRPALLLDNSAQTPRTSLVF